MSKLALVTGGTRGIGKEIAITLKAAGYKVVSIYAGNEEAARALEAEFSITTYKCDVSNFEQCHEVVEKIISDSGLKPGILINNAGITRDRMLHKTTYENWEKVIETNLNSCFNMCHAAINYMRDNRFGRIVNISSINGQVGQLGQTNYSAAKAGMIGFSKALAKENANKGVTVNVVAPGYIATDMTSNMREEDLRSIVQNIPVGRIGNPYDIARAVIFLAADEASFITGSVLSVNGGQYM